jgi:hypothetical protein
MLPDFDRAEAIGSYWGNPQTRTFAEFLIDCAEDQTLRAPESSSPTSSCSGPGRIGRPRDEYGGNLESQSVSE